MKDMSTVNADLMPIMLLCIIVGCLGFLIGIQFAKTKWYKKQTGIGRKK